VEGEKKRVGMYGLARWGFSQLLGGKGDWQILVLTAKRGVKGKKHRGGRQPPRETAGKEKIFRGHFRINLRA